MRGAVVMCVYVCVQSLHVCIKHTKREEMRREDHSCLSVVYDLQHYIPQTVSLPPLNTVYRRLSL